MATLTLNSIPSVRYSKSSNRRRGARKQECLRTLISADSTLVAEIQAYCRQTGASLDGSINEAISEWLQTSALSRLEFFLTKKNGTPMPSIDSLLIDSDVQ